MDSVDTLFITGATGQLGSFILAQLLSERNQVPSHLICARRESSTRDQLVLTREFLKLEPATFEEHPNVHWVTCDISDSAQTFDALCEYCSDNGLNTPVEIIHAAATINLSPKAAKTTNNEELTEEMTLLAELLEVQHFTHISSIAVMGGNAPLGQEEVIGPENFHPNRSDSFLTDYALGKIASELRVWAAQASGLSASIIRPGVILGVGPKHHGPQELWLRARDASFPIGTDGSTGIVDVRDVAAIVTEAHINRVSEPIVAVAYNVPLYQLVQDMGSIMGNSRKVFNMQAQPWLEIMRSVGFLSYLPWVGKFFTPQVRIMLFSKTKYDGSSGGQLHPYRDYRDSLQDCGNFLSKVWR